MRRATVGLLAVFCVAALGCAAVEEQKAMASAPTANVAGTWSGTVGAGMRSATVTLSLSQNGTNATGNISVAGRPDLSGAVTGDVEGQLLKLSVATTTFSTLQVKQDTMTGVSSVGASHPSALEVGGRVNRRTRSGPFRGCTSLRRS